MRDSRHLAVSRAAAALLLCAACHTPPEMPEAVAPELPDTWRSAETAVTDASASIEAAPWWTTFEEPALAQAVEDALAYNPDLIAAATRVLAAEARMRAVHGGSLPQVSAGLDAGRARSGFVGFPVPGQDVLFTNSTRFQSLLSVSWEVDLWGRLGAQTRAAAEEFQATAADYQAARLSLAGQVAKTWLQWQEARLQLDLAQEAVELAEAQRDLVTRRFQNGSATAEMVVEAESGVAVVVAAQLDYELAVQNAARALEVLAGRYPTRETDTPLAALPALPPAPPAGIPAEILDRRPDLHAAAARVEAALAQADATRRALYPRLSLTAQGGTLSRQLGDLLDGDYRTWSLGAGLTAPLIQGGTLRAQADEAAANARAAEIAFAGRLLEACAEVEAGLDTEARVRARLAELEHVEVQAVRALSLSEDRFARGVGDPVAVYRAREDARQARQRLLSARVLLLLNRIDLHLALGGGFVAPQS